MKSGKKNGVLSVSATPKRKAAFDNLRSKSKVVRVSPSLRFSK